MVFLSISVDGEYMNERQCSAQDQWVITVQELIGTYIVSPPNSGKVCATLQNGKGKMYTIYTLDSSNEWNLVRPICLAKDRCGKYLSFEFLWSNFCVPDGVLKMNFCSE
jgi:hypothetical protein